uniref:Uncharacterized protein n=1 Tax=Desertifilum tharense IPPAS B-1220 TaxID=1781255 RepID=A0ACD5GZN1_9CYAN
MPPRRIQKRQRMTLAGRFLQPQQPPRRAPKREERRPLAPAILAAPPNAIPKMPIRRAAPLNRAMERLAIPDKERECVALAPGTQAFVPFYVWDAVIDFGRGDWGDQPELGFRS